MFLHTFAAEAASQGGNPLEALSVNLQNFVLQLVIFLLAFLLLKRFAFTPIVRMLEERRKTIDDGVRMGLKMEKEKAKLDKEIAAEIRKARQEADKIIANSHKEARDVIRDAEKAAQRKAESVLADAEVRLQEEARRAKQNLEKEIVGLVSEATEAIVDEKVDELKDSKIIDEVIKGRKKKK